VEADSRRSSSACGVLDGLDVEDSAVSIEVEEVGDAAVGVKSRRPSSERTRALSHCCSEIKTEEFEAAKTAGKTVVKRR